MATGILGLGSGTSTGLSQELIDKLKDAERKATVEPIETRINSITSVTEGEEGEIYKIEAIKTKVNEFLDSVKVFDLYNTDNTNAFEQIDASSTGTSATYSADDPGSLYPGTTSINITQLAQKDVFQSSTFSDKTVQVAGGNDVGDKISITLGATTYDFSTEGKTYEDLVDEINLSTVITASVEQVGDSSYRLVIKSADTGTANALTVETTGVDIGIGTTYTSSSIADFNATLGAGSFSIDGNTIVADTTGITYNDLINSINGYGGGGVYSATTVGSTIQITAVDGSTITVAETGSNGLDFNDSSKVVSAQNMQATIDNVSYDLSSNQLTTNNGLKITAVSTGESSITISKNTDNILTGVQDLVSKYNELVTMVNDELYSATSPIEDTSSLRTMMEDIKNAIFDNYGASDEFNVFNYGFALDTDGYLSVDTTTFADAITNNLDDLKRLFVGVAEDEGIGTVLKTYVDGLDSTDGLLYNYDENMQNRLTDLQTERDKAIEDLDSKYSLLAQQFASYTAIISQMEASFGGLKMMIQQSTSSG